MKSQLFLGLALTTLSAVLGLPQQAKAYNLEACAKDPMTSAPQVINLLQPIDQKMVNCIPKLDAVASQWQSKANGILSAINGVRIGNQGENEIEKLEYNVTGNTISLVAKVRAKHTWKETIPAVKTKVPVPKWRWVDVPYPDVRWNRKCRLGVCVNVPEPFTNHRREKVPYTVMEIRTITPEKLCLPPHRLPVSTITRSICQRLNRSQYLTVVKVVLVTTNWMLVQLPKFSMAKCLLWVV